jgi:hypothetical protein
LAKVGDRTITLGDYAATLGRMDRFERMRYQTADRREKLLEEMINVELLAREAERRGLDQSPRAKELTRQLLRDELLRQEREKLPKLDELPEAEVRSYYEAHLAEFRDPERRRVGDLVVAEKAQAGKLLAQAKAASPVEWGTLVREHSLLSKGSAGDKTESQPPLELAGDLGLVSAPGQAQGANPKVPEPVRHAVFQLENIGDVAPEVIAADGRFHIVRLMGKSAPRTRTFQEAERAVRLKLLAERIEQSERALLESLEKKFPAVINEAALEGISAPPPSVPPEPEGVPAPSLAPSSATPKAPAPTTAPVKTTP